MGTRGFNRRQFLRKAAGSAAAAMSFPYVVRSLALGKAGSVAASNRITMGFIGTGKQSKHLMRSFLGAGGTQVVAACDVDKLKIERGKKIVEDHYGKKSGGTYKGCKAYGDFRELVARDDIDAVVISTPDHWHAITVIQSAKAGKDIYCEKPLSQSIVEARAMVNAVRQYSRVFQTGSMQRSARNFRFACELVHNGYIGEVKHVTVGVGGPPPDKPLAPQPVPDYLDWDMWVGPAPWRPYHSELSPHLSWDGFPHWRNHSSFGGGGMTDWGAHHFDIAQWGLGMDESGPVEIIPPDKDHKALTYKYAGGITMTRPDSLKNIQLGADEIHLYDSKNHYADWLNAIRTRSKPICDIETGCRTVSVCHLGNIAYRLGRPLKWDPEREVFVGDSEASRLLSRPMRSPWHL